MDIDIRGLLKSSFNEWEGRISAVVFTANCNWRCPYCHGRTLVEEPQSFPPITPEEVFSFLKVRKDWTDGVVVTGGEPTLQPGLVEFIRELKRILPVKLENNGTRPAVVRELLAENLLECLCFDYKAPLDERLVQLARVPESVTAVEQVRESFQIAREVAPQTAAAGNAQRQVRALGKAAGLEVEFHTTLCPAFITLDILREMGAALQCPGALWVLQQYETDAPMLDAAASGARRFSTEELDELEATAKSVHPRVLMRRGKQ